MSWLLVESSLAVTAVIGDHWGLLLRSSPPCYPHTHIHTHTHTLILLLVLVLLLVSAVPSSPQHSSNGLLITYLFFLKQRFRKTPHCAFQGHSRQTTKGLCTGCESVDAAYKMSSPWIHRKPGRVKLKMSIVPWLLAPAPPLIVPSCLPSLTRDLNGWHHSIFLIGMWFA